MNRSVAFWPKLERIALMNGPSRFLTVAVILSALPPAALTACAMWGGDIWASLLKSGDAIILTRISQQMTCVGAANQRKMFCDKRSREWQEFPRANGT
jgi:hypothetical protein